MANPLTSSQFVRLLDARLRKVSEDTFNEIPSMIDNFYTVLPSDSAFEEFYEIGSLPDIPEFSGKLTYLNVAPGYHNKIEPKEYAAGVEIQRKLTDDKKYAVLDNWAKKLAQSAARKREKIGVRPFAYAFSTAFDFQDSEEGVSLCSDSHTTKAQGVSTSSGFDNAGSTAFNKTSVEATRLLMRKFKNDIGERIEIEPDLLIVPDNLADKAEEITATPSGLYTAESTVNVNYRRFRYLPYKRLDDYSTTDWYMVDSGLMKQFLIWIDRIKNEPNNTIDFETFMIKHSIYFRIGNGHLNWRWIYGHNV